MLEKFQGVGPGELIEPSRSLTFPGQRLDQRYGLTRQKNDFNANIIADGFIGSDELLVRAPKGASEAAVTALYQ